MNLIPVHPLMPDVFFCNCKSLLLFRYLRTKYSVNLLYKIRNRKIRILEDSFSCFNLTHIQNLINDS